MTNKFYIVVPSFNEEDNIENFIKDVDQLNLNNFSYNIIFVDDGSTDETWKKIEYFNSINEKVIGIKLTRNFGKDSAIEAGLNFVNKDSNCKFAIIIDADLQHPIKKIPEMIIEWEKNFKIVTTYKKNNVENILRKIGSDLFYFLMTKFSDAKFITKNTDFMLIDKKIIEIFSNFLEKNKSIKTFINWTGYKNKSLEIEIEKRKEGKSKFNFLYLTRIAVNAITSFSFFPLKIVGYLGFIMSLFSIILIPVLIFFKWINFFYVSFQTIIIIFNIFLTGITLSCLGLLGIYISKIHQNSISRPSYIVEKNLSEKK